MGLGGTVPSTVEHGLGNGWWESAGKVRLVAHSGKQGRGWGQVAEVLQSVAGAWGTARGGQATWGASHRAAYEEVQTSATHSESGYGYGQHRGHVSERRIPVRCDRPNLQPDPLSA